MHSDDFYNTAIKQSYIGSPQLLLYRLSWVLTELIKMYAFLAEKPDNAHYESLHSVRSYLAAKIHLVLFVQNKLSQKWCKFKQRHDFFSHSHEDLSAYSAACDASPGLWSSSDSKGYTTFLYGRRENIQEKKIQEKLGTVHTSKLLSLSERQL